ncbi:MAG: hypothetical protein GXP33_04465 [Spirochaetes bacterium]|nr:hypothetical protein [Spirochaetota bacterium]
MYKYDYKISDIKRLEKEAIKVDKMINVSARKYYEVYMSLGEAYYQYNYLDKSLAALKKGLRLKSRDYEHQLLAANIEFKLNMLDYAYNRSKQIIKNAESKKIIKAASRLLNRIKARDYKPGSNYIPEMYGKYVYLVRIDPVDEMLLEALKNRIEEEYKITVNILPDVIDPSKKEMRDLHDNYYQRVAEKFIEINGRDAYDSILDSIKINKEIASDNDLKKEFVHFLYLQEENGQKLWKENMSKIQNQYNAEILRKQLYNIYYKKVNEKDCLGILGVTAHDIYAKDYNFLFGWSGSQTAVMSYNRFVTEDASVTLRIKRTVMQGLSSVGFLVGIPRCTTAACARAYPHSLKEQDAKEDTLGYECRRNLIELYNTKMK